MASSAPIAERSQKRSLGGREGPGKVTSSSSVSNRSPVSWAKEKAASAPPSARRVSLVRQKYFEQGVASKEFPVRNQSLTRLSAKHQGSPITNSELRRSLSLSIADCLMAVNERQQANISNAGPQSTTNRSQSQHGNNNNHNSNDSVGEMPSVVSYGHGSTFSKQSQSSNGSTFSLSTGSVDLSQLSSATPDSVITSSTFSSARRKASGGESAAGSAGNAPPPTPSPCFSFSPIQSRRIQPQLTDEPARKRSLLKKSAQNYQPDELPRRELRWKTEEPSQVPPPSVMRWSRPGAARASASSKGHQW